MMNEQDTSTSCYTNNMYGSIAENGENFLSDVHCNSLLYDLSLLKDKVHSLHSIMTVLITPGNHNASMAMASVGTLVQEVIGAASSMMFTCQQMGMMSNSGDQNLQWYDQTTYNSNNSNANLDNNSNIPQNISIYANNRDIVDIKGGVGICANNRDIVDIKGGVGKGILVNNCDIIELEASDILAKYTHYCHVCGKGFKRDANLRMHMRAHGEEYKSPSALSNPTKKTTDEENHELSKLPKKYSCPQEGCRWNKKHVKFTPLKSMICVKNHYKRSHCPKMYVCKRCSLKQFSVLSDLRTHEKHCGDVKWLCSCGTSFSRKDKLMGHVALFVGHVSAVN